MVRGGGSDAVLKRLAGMEKRERQPLKATQGERVLVLLCFFHLVFLDSSGEIAGCAMVSPVEICLKPLDDDWLCTCIQVLMLNY